MIPFYQNRFIKKPAQNKVVAGFYWIEPVCRGAAQP